MTNVLPVTSGLVGWYQGEEWNGTSWPDSSGNGNNVTTKVGVIKVQGRFIYGGAGDSLTFPTAILPTTYTLFHIAKYNGPLRKRIFNGSTNNWLSGFWNGVTGVAYHGDLLTQTATPQVPLSDIIISADQKNLYRMNGINKTINTVTGVNTRLNINTGTVAEPSDWAVSEVIVYDRELTLAEIESVEAYLETRKNQIDFMTIQSNLGGVNPISIDEYYGTSSYVPSSGTISLNTFRRLAQVPLIGIPPKNLQVFLDAADTRSYPGTGLTWFDISGNGRNGTWNSVSHQSTYFDVNTRWCTGPPSNSIGITNTTGYTIFIVFNQNSRVATGAFKFYGNGSVNRGIFSHCTWSDGIIYFDQGGCCGADTRTNIALPNPTGTWHSVAFVRETNSSTRRIYIDGTLAITNTATAADIQLNTTAVDYIGSIQNYQGTWDAKSRCFLAYNRGLTAGEISSLHNITIQTVPDPTPSAELPVAALGALDTLGESVYSNVSGGYALRRLFGSYTGPQVRVRRFTMYDQKDFYFDNDGLPVGDSIESWLDGDVGHVMIWYDQGPNAKHTTSYGTSDGLRPSPLKRADGLYTISFPGTSTTSGGYFNSGSFTFNIASKGGVSTFARANMLSAYNWERVFDFGNAAGNANHFMARIGTTNNTRYSLFNGTTEYVHDVSGTIINNTWQTFSNRIKNVGTNSWDYLTRINGTNYTLNRNVFFGDRTVNNSYIGKSNWNDSLSNMQLECLLFFDTGSITDTDFQTMETVFTP